MRVEKLKAGILLFNDAIPALWKHSHQEELTEIEEAKYATLANYLNELSEAEYEVFCTATKKMMDRVREAYDKEQEGKV